MFLDGNGRCDRPSAVFRTRIARRSRHPFELVVVIGIQEIVLAIVLVVDDGFHSRKTFLEQPMFSSTFRTGTVSITAPSNIGAGKIVFALPAALIDQRLQSRAVSARFRSKYSVAGTFRRDCLLDPFGQKAGVLALGSRGERVLLLAFVKCGNGADGGIEQIDLCRKGIAEEAGYSQCDVHARTIQDVERQDFETGHAA